LDTFPEVEDRSFGKFMAWLINEENRVVYGMKLPTGFQVLSMALE
jgi:hypothetical protein